MPRGSAASRDQPAFSKAIGGSCGPTRTLGPAITIFAFTGDDSTIDVVVSPYVRSWAITCSRCTIDETMTLIM